MGRDKALLEVGGRPMARRVADALLEAGAGEVAVAGGDAPALRALGLEVWPDQEPGAGPLAAVIGALRRARHDLVLIAGCDLLHPDPAVLRATVAGLITEDPGGPVVSVPVVGGVRQWHHAAWRREAEAGLALARAEGVGSLRRAALRLRVRDLPAADAAWARAVEDADEPDDLPPTGR